MAGTCMDLDECMTLDQNDCLPPTTCSNTPGSYECICPDGNVVDAAGNCGSSQPGCPSQPPCGQGCFDAGGICKDLNECMTFDQHHCKPGSTCVNNDGGYTCICPNGNEANLNGVCLGTGYEKNKRSFFGFQNLIPWINCFFNNANLIVINNVIYLYFHNQPRHYSSRLWSRLF